MKKAAIFSVPRSGSSWLGQIFNSHPNVCYRFQPNFAYSFPYNLTPQSKENEIENFYDELLKTKDPFVCGKLSISSRKNLEFEKETPQLLMFKETHFLTVIENLIINSETKVVAIMRSPFATINSWIKIPKEFDPSWSVKDEWENASKKNEGKTSHYFGYNKWKESVRMFDDLQERFPAQFYLLKYESLLDDTLIEIEKLFAFFSLDIHPNTIEFINQSKSKSEKDSYSIFRKKESDDGWKKELPHEIISAIKEDQEFKNLNKKHKWIQE